MQGGSVRRPVLSRTALIATAVGAVVLVSAFWVVTRGWDAASAPGQAADRSAGARPQGASHAEGARDLYQRNCGACHGRNLRGTETGPPLAGRAFELAWQDRTGDQIYHVSRTTMPPGSAGSLSDAIYLEIASYILERNGYDAGPEGARAELERLQAITIRPRPSP